MVEYTSSLFKKVPSYMLEKRNQIIMVLFVSVFAIIFINIYKPFGSDKWIGVGDITDTMYFVWSTLLVTTGMLVVAGSRMVMYRVSRRPDHNITILRYILWVFLELVMLSGAFTIIALIVGQNLNFEAYDPLSVFLNAMQNTVFIIGIPYFICVLYFSYGERSAKLKALMNENIGFKSSLVVCFSFLLQRKTCFILSLPIIIYVYGITKMICSRNSFCV